MLAIKSNINLGPAFTASCHFIHFILLFISFLVFAFCKFCSKLILLYCFIRNFTLYLLVSHGGLSKDKNILLKMSKIKVINFLNILFHKTIYNFLVSEGFLLLYLKASFVPFLHFFLLSGDNSIFLSFKTTEWTFFNLPQNNSHLHLHFNFLWCK